MIKKIGAVVIAALGIYMMYLGNKAGAQPPFVTGIGFIVLAIMFLSGKGS